MPHPVSLPLLLALAAPAAAQTLWYVDVSGSPPGSGTQDDPYTSIQYAIDQPGTLAGDVLQIAPGVYPENVLLTGKHLTLRGPAGAAQTRVDGQGQGPCLRVDGPATVGTIVRGLTLEGGEGWPGSWDDGGSPFSGGGGLWARDTGLRLRQVRLAGNSAEVGGGAFLRDSHATLEDCSFDSMAYERGGALFATGGQLIVRGGRFEGSTASLGGSIALVQGLARILDSSFTGIGPPVWIDATSGGAIHGEDSSLLVEGCEFTGLGAWEYSPGIHWIGGDLFVRQCRFRGCSSYDYGGTIGVRDGDVHVAGTSFLDGYCSYGWGAGIWAERGQLLVEDCAFRSGYAAEGGAVSLWEAQAEFRGCVFENNESDADSYWETGNGGAVMVWDSAAAHFERCEFRDNRAWGESTYGWIGEGGAVEGPATFEHCTFAGNRARDPNGGPGLGGAVSGALSLSHSIVWDCGPAALHDVLEVSWSDVEGGWPGDGNLDADPLFWFADDVHLRAGSPCIDAGDPAQPPDEDGSPPDLGAYPYASDYYPDSSTYCVPKPSASGCVALIAFGGSPSLTGSDDFHVLARSLPPHRVGALIWGPNPDLVPFWDGAFCVDEQTATTSQLLDSGPGGPCRGRYDLAFTQAQMAAAGLSPGDVLYAQFWFRDPAGPGGLGLTDALRFVIRP